MPTTNITCTHLLHQDLALSKARAFERKVLTRNHRVVGQHLGAGAALLRGLRVGSAVVGEVGPALPGMARLGKDLALPSKTLKVFESLWESLSSE